jgi:predicted nucleic acid-binding protein
VKKLADVLANVARLAVDTAPVIYFVEANPRFDALVVEVFQQISRGSLLGVTSVITLGEVLVRPIADGNTHLQQEYRDLLLRSANFQTIPITPASAERAADLRARFKLRMPDALQLSVGLDAGADAFLTNDAGLRRVTDLPVLLLEELAL